MRRVLPVPAVALAGILLALSFVPVRAFAPGNAAFQRTWERTDQPVAAGTLARTWIWGPEATTGVVDEAYVEAPGGKRQVQYYDKSRMEINNPGGDPNSPFYVTNGLLVVELMSGRLQLGDNLFETHKPAEVNVAGDPDDPLTYADLAPLRNEEPWPDGATITARFDTFGMLIDDPSLASQGVTAAFRVQVPGIDHQVASPFWEFLNSSGPVRINGQNANERLFDPWFYATGLPITEAYWANVKVGGTPRLVLLQCFERRCLTYTPGNPAGFRVEAGNVGQHYHHWRYDILPGEETPTATEYAFSHQWGSLYTAVPPLVGPYSVRVDGNTFWAVDTDSGRFLQFNADGVFQRSLGAPGMSSTPGLFSNPSDMAVGPDGRLYFLDTYNYRVQVYSPEGGYLTSWGSYGTGNGQFDAASVIAIHNNLVYVSDYGNHRVQFFNLEGTYQGQLGSEGNGNGQFKQPVGLAWDAANNLYVVDRELNRVQKFDTSGNYLGQFGSVGYGQGQFYLPWGIAINSAGEIYVADTYSDRIQQFNPNGSFLREWGSTGNGPGQFSYPSGLSLDAAGNVYVADYGNKRIQVFDAAGSYRFEVHDGRRSAFGSLTDLLIDHDGRVVVVDGGLALPRVQRFSPGGTPLDDFGTSGAGIGQFISPTGIAQDAAGNYYITDTGNNRVVVYSEDWGFLREWGGVGSGEGQFDQPWGIAVDTAGNVYVADRSNNRIQKFTGEGGFLEVWGAFGEGEGEFSGPADIAIRGNRVYVTDAGNFRVQVLDLNGEYQFEWGGLGATPGTFTVPFGITIDAGGYVYVVDSAISTVQKFSAEGEWIATIGRNGSDTGELLVPWGVAVDSAGNVYVADSSNYRMQVFAPVEE